MIRENTYPNIFGFVSTESVSCTLWMCRKAFNQLTAKEIKMSHQMHLHKNGSGWFAKTACGRNIYQAPLATDWKGFLAQPEGYRCIKCSNSKQAEFNARAMIKSITWEAA